MPRKRLLAKVSSTTIAIGAAVVVIGAAVVVAARRKKQAKPTSKVAQTTAKELPPEAPEPSPLPEPAPTSAPVETSMELIGMTINPTTYTAGVEGSNKCRIVTYGPIPALARFDPFQAVSEERTKIKLNVETTLSFIKQDGSFAGCLRRTTNLQITYTPKWEQLSLDVQKKNPAEACPGFDSPSPSYTIVPHFQPKVEEGLLSIRGTLKYTDPSCDIAFVNVSMVPQVTSVVVEG